jgi:hypothetical protein
MDHAEDPLALTVIACGLPSLWRRMPYSSMLMDLVESEKLV